MDGEEPREITGVHVELTADELAALMGPPHPFFGASQMEPHVMRFDFDL